jgi:hypothetical protein
MGGLIGPKSGANAAGGQSNSVEGLSKEKKLRNGFGNRREQKCRALDRADRRHGRELEPGPVRRRAADQETNHAHSGAWPGLQEDVTPFRIS